jgi:inosine-uridine nucleoside N-ribohydrolase
VVVDSDLALDDLVALTFLLTSTDVDVRAVTVSGTGEVRCPQGLAVLRGLLTVTGDEKVPVACGRSTPLAGGNVFPSEWRDMADDGWGLNLPMVPAPATERSAVDLLRDTLGRGGVTLLTLGPLTNVAEAFRADSGLAERVSSIVMMGGALDVPGNVSTGGSKSSQAEWNVYVDPAAAAEVLASGAKTLMVPLDATNRLPISGDFLEQLHANSHTKPAELVDTLITNNPQVYTAQAYFWDPLAAAAVVDHELLTTETVTISVVTTPGADNGRTVRSRGGTSVTIARDARATAFHELLLRTLDRLRPTAPLAAPEPPVANAMIRFDAGTCSYDGPSTVRAGRMRFTFATTDPAWTGAVVSLTGELSIREVLDWVTARPHHRGAVPGVSQAVPVAPGVVMYVDVAPPRTAVVCAADDPVPTIGGSFTVR